MEQIKIPGTEVRLFAVQKSTGLIQKMVVTRDTDDCYFTKPIVIQNGVETVIEGDHGEFRVRKDTMRSQAWAFFFQEEAAHKYAIGILKEMVAAQRSRISRAQKLVNQYNELINKHQHEINKEE